MTSPLDGVTVVTMEHAVAAPYATRILADAGARVIKIERPGSGDFARHFDGLAGGTGAHFAWCNRNKESLTLDVTDSRGREILEQLIGLADVFVHNLGPGSAQRLDVDGNAVLDRHPTKVVCEISGYGTGGPYDDRRAYDLLIQAEAGVATVTGSLAEPIKPGIGIGDISAGIFGANAVLSALLLRTRSGKGSVLEVSMLDAMMDWMAYPLIVAKHGGEPQLSRGMSHPAVSPYDAYATSDDRLVAISVQNDREWQRLAVHYLDEAAWVDDDRFATNEARVEHRPEIDAALARTVRTRSAAVTIELLHSIGIACAMVNSVHEVAAHPQLEERARWMQVPSPTGRVFTPLAPPVSSTWTTPSNAVPALGEHTDSILSELGLSTALIEQLKRAGTV